MTLDSIRSLYNKWKSKKPQDAHPGKDEQNVPKSIPVSRNSPVKPSPDTGITPQKTTDNERLHVTAEISSRNPPAIRNVPVPGNDLPGTLAGKPVPSYSRTTAEIRYHPDIFASLRDLARTYSLSEITIATDDGLVLATSASRDVEFDAVHYSQVVQLMTSPSEPDVSLFEFHHKGSHLIGIIRSDHHIHPVLKEQIRDDTKVILQWWL